MSTSCTQAPSGPFASTCPIDATVVADAAPPTVDPYEEAIVELDRVGANAVAYFHATGGFPEGAAPELPATGCCRCVAPGGEGCSLDNVCDAVIWSDPVWEMLQFRIDQATRFQYSYFGTASSFEAQALGDLDCDTIFITYTLDGSVVGGEPTLALTVPAQGTD